MIAAADRIWDLQQTAPPTVAEVAPTKDQSMSMSPYSGGLSDAASLTWANNEVMIQSSNTGIYKWWNVQRVTFMHIYVTLCKVDGPESQLPLPVRSVHHKHGPRAHSLGTDGTTHFCSEKGKNL